MRVLHVLDVNEPLVRSSTIPQLEAKIWMLEMEAEGVRRPLVTRALDYYQEF